MLNGIVNYDFWAPEPTDAGFPGIKEFLKEYQARAEKAGVDPLGYYLPPYSYAMVQVLGQAIEAHQGPRPAEARRLHPRHRVQHDRRQGEVRQERRVGQGPHAHGPVPEDPGHGHRSVPRAGQEGRALPRRAQVRQHHLPVLGARRTSARSASLFSWDLLANAVVAGLLLGGFYAAVSLGVSLIFGLLDIANIAQPAFVILGSYAAYVMNTAFGLDPILAGSLFTPVFYVLGAVVYRVYYASFERRGEESLRGLVFFFGLLFIMEVSLSLKFGVDYRLVAGAVHRQVDRARRRRHRLPLPRALRRRRSR